MQVSVVHHRGEMATDATVSAAKGVALTAHVTRPSMSAAEPRQPARQPARTRHTSLPASARRFSGVVTLWTGDVFRLRPIRPSDGARLRSFHAGLSESSVTFRFFTYLPALPRQTLDHLTHVNYHDRMALIVTTQAPPDEQIIAVGRYERIGALAAEVAFAVADAWQRHGLGTALLLLLAEYARAQGFTTFVAYVMTENTRMLKVLENAGFPLTASHTDGKIDISLDITTAPSGSLAPIRFTADDDHHQDDHHR